MLTPPYAGGTRYARAATASQANTTTGVAQTSRLRQGMRRIATTFVFALLCTAPLASAQKAIDITPVSIAGIHLGMPKAKATSLMTKPLRHDLLEDGYERFVSPKQKVEIYFRKGTKGVAVE